MIQLVITSTAKGYSPKSEWHIFDERTETFQDKKEAMEWIKENYPGKTRRPIFRDTDKGIIKVGYIIGFRNSGWGSGSRDNWLQQDWIEFRESRPITP